MQCVQVFYPGYKEKVLKKIFKSLSNKLMKKKEVHSSPTCICDGEGLESIPFGSILKEWLESTLEDEEIILRISGILGLKD